MYKYGKKSSKRVHIVDPKTGNTYCKLENSIAGRKLKTVAETYPENRHLCLTCIDMQSIDKEGIKPGNGRYKKAYSDGKKAFYQSWEWAKLRLEVLKAYGAICMCCRATENICVDHIKSRRRYPHLELDFDNLQVLCDFCNRGKSWDDETDFRPKKPEPELPDDQMEHLNSIQ